MNQNLDLIKRKMEESFDKMESVSQRIKGMLITREVPILLDVGDLEEVSTEPVKPAPGKAP